MKLKEVRRGIKSRDARIYKLLKACGKRKAVGEGEGEKARKGS